MSFDQLPTQKDWDSYGGLPTRREAIQRAKNFLEALPVLAENEPAIVPLSDGGLQLEWHVGGWEVEVPFADPDVAEEAVMVRRSKGEAA